MKDNSGFTNWETERMFTYAERVLDRIPFTLEQLVGLLRSYENTILQEGRKSFILYEADPVNYWEVYARLVMSALLHARVRFLVPGYKELTNGK